MPKKKIDFEDLANQLAEELALANESLLRERADAANVRRRADNKECNLKVRIPNKVIPFILKT